MKYGGHFPVSHLFHEDPETIEMIELFGDRAVFVWHKLLSWGDKNEGEIIGTPHTVSKALAQSYSGDLRKQSDKIRRRFKGTNLAARVQLLLYWMCIKRWLLPVYAPGFVDEWSQNHDRIVTEWLLNGARIVTEWSRNHPEMVAEWWPNGARIVGFKIRNFLNYHRRRDANSPSPNLTSPNLTQPDLTSSSKREGGGGSTLPDFLLTDQRREYAISHGVKDVEATCLRFKRHHRVTGELLTDQEWTDWIATEREFSSGSNGRSLEAGD